MDDALASLHDLTVHHGAQRALDGITLSIASGERLAVVGPNGAGKSTLLRALAGDLETKGAARLGGDDPARLPAATLAQRRAFLEQSPQCAWDFTVRAVAALGSNLAAADTALSTLGLESLTSRHINALSGGEQRLVHLARCLAQLGDPAGKVLLLDEPTASLDPAHAATIQAAMARVASQGGGVVCATHDLVQAAACDRIVLLSKGRLQAIGKPADVLVPAVTRKAWGLALSVTRDAMGRVTVTTES